MFPGYWLAGCSGVKKVTDMDYQHIYLYMDDSGKISQHEDYAVFAGIVFTSSPEVSEFKNKYKSIVRNIKCKYCSQVQSMCDGQCPEIKASIINSSDRRRFINLSKSHITFCTVILNQNLNSTIVNNVPSKGRFTEYSQRRIIKKTMEYLINTRAVDPHKPIYLHINIDEMPTKTNGYYSLREGIIEELRYGIINFNYGHTFKPIVHNLLEAQVIYRDSKCDVGIQMADIIANTVRHSFVINSNYFETRKYLKETCKINVILRLPN